MEIQWHLVLSGCCHLLTKPFLLSDYGEGKEGRGLALTDSSLSHRATSSHEPEHKVLTEEKGPYLNANESLSNKKRKVILQSSEENNLFLTGSGEDSLF